MRIMKATKPPRTAKKRKNYGVVANGSAGAWQVAVDETLAGTQQWFAQLESPNCYLYFEIQHPNVMAQIAEFVDSNLQREGSRAGCSESKPAELKLGLCGGHTVEFLWDWDSSHRCFLLVRGVDEFRLRVTLLRSDLQALAGALQQVCAGLRADGLLPLARA